MNKELKSIKSLLLNKDENNHVLAIQLMKGLDLSISEVVELITLDDFTIYHTVDWGMLYSIKGYGPYNSFLSHSYKSRLSTLMKCQVRSHKYLKLLKRKYEI